MSYTLRQNPAQENNYTKTRLGNTIDKIVIHHAATTDFDGIGRTFQNPNRFASAHYGVGRNSNVDQYVQEDDIAWHAGNWPANCTSVGIENVNSSGAPDWDIAPETFNTLVELVRDIANRHGLLPVKVGVNFFGHHDFSSTACPGQLYGRLQELADAVNNGTSGGGSVSQPSSSDTDQILTIGSHIEFDAEYRVDGLANVGGIWQVQTNALCPKGFTWADNGIPTEPLVETSDSDQVLAVGSRYKIPGKYEVKNLGQYQDRWMAQINMNGWNLWVDAETVTEVAA